MSGKPAVFWLVLLGVIGAVVCRQFAGIRVAGPQFQVDAKEIDPPARDNHYQRHSASSCHFPRTGSNAGESMPALARRGEDAYSRIRRGNDAKDDASSAMQGLGRLFSATGVGDLVRATMSKEKDEIRSSKGLKTTSWSSWPRKDNTTTERRSASKSNEKKGLFFVGRGRSSNEMLVSSDDTGTDDKAGNLTVDKPVKKKRFFVSGRSENSTTTSVISDGSGLSDLPGAEPEKKKWSLFSGRASKSNTTSVCSQADGEAETNETLDKEETGNKESSLSQRSEEQQNMTSVTNSEKSDSAVLESSDEGTPDSKSGARQKEPIDEVRESFFGSPATRLVRLLRKKNDSNVESSGAIETVARCDEKTDLDENCSDDSDEKNEAPDEERVTACLGNETETDGVESNATKVTSESGNGTTTRDQRSQLMPRRGSYTSYIISGPPPTTPPGGIHRPMRRDMPMQQSPNTVAIVEALGAMLGAISRLLFLTWLTRLVANQEEEIRPTQHFAWERLNDRYIRDGKALQNALQAPPSGIAKGRWRRGHFHKLHARKRQPRRRFSEIFTRTVIVVEVGENPKDGITFEQMPGVATFLLEQHSKGVFGQRKRTGRPLELEIVFLVDSPGGSVSRFGLAAAQMKRLSNVDGITTTVVVDNIAASGGYMIASQAHKILASPFAYVGSIGVYMEGLNYNSILEKYGVKPLVLKAGKHKHTLSAYGRVTDNDIRHEEERLTLVHDAFKRLVLEGRPAMGQTLENVADGTAFLGGEALNLKLVDGLMTSDEYILERVLANDRVLKLHRTMQARQPRRMLPLSPWELLPYLTSWAKRLDKQKVVTFVAVAAQYGGVAKILQELFTAIRLK